MTLYKNPQRIFYPATMKNKKAVGHVETVLSFVIFIGFLAFLLAIFNPFSDPIDSSLIDNVVLKMNEQLTIEVSRMSIRLDNSPGGCFSIVPINDLKCTSGNIIVKDKEGNKLNANLWQIEESTLTNSDDKLFYTIYCSEELIGNPTGGGCIGLTEDDYTLGIIVERNPWSESKITDFVDNYTNDYNNLKTQIVPQGNDFRFFIWDLNNLDGDPLFEATRETPLGIRIDSRTIGIDVLDNEANIIQRTLNIQVW